MGVSVKKVFAVYSSENGRKFAINRFILFESLFKSKFHHMLVLWMSQTFQKDLGAEISGCSAYVSFSAIANSSGQRPSSKLGVQ